MDYLTFSKINIYWDCPLLYKWINIDKKICPRPTRLEKENFIKNVLKSYYKHKKGSRIDLASLKYNLDLHWDNIYKNIFDKKFYVPSEQMLMDFVIRNNYSDMQTIDGLWNIYIPELQIRLFGKFDIVKKTHDKIEIINCRLYPPQDSEKKFLYILSIQCKAINYLYHTDNFIIKDIYIGTGESKEYFMTPFEYESKVTGGCKAILDDTQLLPQKNQWCDDCYIRKNKQCQLYLED